MDEAAQEDELRFSKKEVCNVLCIVTGGTICMVQSPNGFVPAKGLY